MTDEKASREQIVARQGIWQCRQRQSRRSRKGRRRYFQPKKDGRSQPSGNQPGGQAAARPTNPANHSARRTTTGAAKGSAAKKRPGSARPAAAPAPASATTTTASPTSKPKWPTSPPNPSTSTSTTVHPELRDSYEFRPDHFSKVGRTLADYQIDLSKLFPGDIADDGTPVLTNMLPKPQFDWSDWEERSRSEAERRRRKDKRRAARRNHS